MHKGVQVLRFVKLVVDVKETLPLSFVRVLVLVLRMLVCREGHVTPQTPVVLNNVSIKELFVSRPLKRVLLSVKHHAMRHLVQREKDVARVALQVIQRKDFKDVMTRVLLTT
jgi:hypothetical protein